MIKSKICIRFTVLIFFNVSFYFNVVNTIDEDEGYPVGNTDPICRIPEAPINGHVKCDNTKEKPNFASDCTFHCKKGYYLEGEKSKGSEGDINSEKITCKENGEWTSKTPKCTKYVCKKTVEVSNGKCTSTDNGNNGLSHECTLTCKKYFQVKPSISLVCGSKKQWIGSLPSCERVLCDKPNPPKNGLAKCASTNVANKYSSCILTCENQYKMSSEKNNKDELTIQCYLDSNGTPTWDYFPSECKSSQGPLCNKPKALMNGYLKCNDSKVKPNLAHKCVYHCNKGFFLEGSEGKNNAMIIKCLGNDKWNISLPRCISALCEPIKDIIKGSVICTKRNQYIECEIKCDPGYYFSSSETYTTRTTGCYLNKKGVYEYDNYYKECILTPCKKPTLKWPLDGECSGNHCDLWCATRYQLEGKNKMDCFNNEWSELLPICKNPSKFPIGPKPCSENLIEICRSIANYIYNNTNILKKLVTRCYDWKELCEKRRDYVITQYKLPERKISQVINYNRATDCAFVSDIDEKYDGKRNCDELCRRSYKLHRKDIPFGGYNVGNEKVTRTCICVIKHFYNFGP